MELINKNKFFERWASTHYIMTDLNNFPDLWGGIEIIPFAKTFLAKDFVVHQRAIKDQLIEHILGVV